MEDARLEVEFEALPADTSDAPDTFSSLLAAEANDLQASVERFLDEAMIEDMRQTPLTTVEEVLEERSARRERDQRVLARAAELRDEDAAKERHAAELRDLEEIVATSTPAEGGRPGSRQAGPAEQRRQADAARKAEAAAARAGAEDVNDPSWAAAVATAPVKLEGAGRSKGLTPYVPDLSEFAPEPERNRQRERLEAENELLRKCLANGRDPKAFQSYLHANTTQ